MPFQVASPGIESLPRLIQEGITAVDRRHWRLARKRVIQDLRDDIRRNTELGETSRHRASDVAHHEVLDARALPNPLDGLLRAEQAPIAIERRPSRTASREDEGGMRREGPEDL